LYRGLGRIGDGGVFEPPLSYVEALTRPAREMEVFLMLDDLIAILLRQQLEKQKKKKGIK
jgi:hypothetical protein